MPVGMGAAGACVCLCRRDRNIYCCLYKLSTWRICRILSLSLHPTPNGIFECFSLNSADAGMCIGLGKSMEDKASGQTGVITAQRKDAEIGWGRRKADFSLCQWKGWKGREGEREQKQRKRCGIKSRVCAVLKHTYRPVLGVWDETVSVSTGQLTPFA